MDRSTHPSASFLKALVVALDALRQLAAALPKVQTRAERVAMLQAIRGQASTVILLINEVLDAEG